MNQVTIEGIDKPMATMAIPVAVRPRRRPLGVIPALAPCNILKAPKSTLKICSIMADIFMTASTLARLFTLTVPAVFTPCTMVYSA